MGKLRYALEPGQPKQLEIAWSGMWKQVAVTFDGAAVGSVEDKKQLQDGREFTLPDGSTLALQLRQRGMSTELQVLRNGLPVPGSATDPQTRLSSAYGVIFFVAGLSAVLGAAALILQLEFLLQLGLGAWSLVAAAVYAVLGVLVKRRVLAALLIAIALFALDGALLVVFAVEQGMSPSAGSIVVRIVLLLLMARGVGAIRALRANEAGEAGVASSQA